ncbi:MAG: hypothetical protein H0X66_16555 [Verrucomicrobia bacterium]|nr:hypothetical protein [Verrucomicrobiota bacterium]
MPSQSGTWYGVCREETLYTFEGKPQKVALLSLEAGPTAEKAKGTLRSPKGQMIAPAVVLVDKRQCILKTESLIGKRLRVEGNINSETPVHCETGSELVRSQPQFDAEKSWRPPVIVTSLRKIEILSWDAATETEKPTAR